jgi:hypothetical protein
MLPPLPEFEDELLELDEPVFPLLPLLLLLFEDEPPHAPTPRDKAPATARATAPVPTLCIAPTFLIAHPYKGSSRGEP